MDEGSSVRGEDTRKGFAGHLHEALHQRGIKTFIDEESLERGKNIKERIFSAIERSAVCIPILSPSYADSRWCLMELAKMVEFRKKIIPIFYHVDPSDVRHQRGAFEAAFQSYQLRFDRSTVMEWRNALREAADISGYDLRNVANG
ncbi:TMV resistance protein [Nymphaea thermarum]|nr:TMV resistance protein [Nymphaea thermarum]